MRLHFLRHGIAEDREPARTDFDRKLTRAGIAQMRQVALGMLALDLKLDTVLSSPRIRARETAEIVAKALNLPVTLEPRLESGHSFTDLEAALQRLPGSARVLLVGHEPDFSEDVGILIGGGCVRMKKAALACVDAERVAPGGGVLRWLLEPDHLSGLG